MPVYGPPATLRAGEAGVVIDGRIDTADVVAAVVDLAVRGYLRLERVTDFDGDEVLVTVARPWLHEKDIRPFEVVLLAHVFTSGVHMVRLSELRGTSYAPTSIKETLSSDLVDRGLFAGAPLSVRHAGRWLALVVTAGWAQLAWNAGASVSTILAAAATGLLLWLLASLVSRGFLTAHGRRARAHLMGFREYLARVDKARLEQLRPGALDEHLPWAIALGVTKGWLA